MPAPPITWGPASAHAASPVSPALRVGAYVTNVSDIDLLDDRFSIELWLWTLWQGDPDLDPSDQ